MKLEPSNSKSLRGIVIRGFYFLDRNCEVLDWNISIVFHCCILVWDTKHFGKRFGEKLTAALKKLSVTFLLQT